MSPCKHFFIHIHIQLHTGLRLSSQPYAIHLHSLLFFVQRSPKIHNSCKMLLSVKICPGGLKMGSCEGDHLLLGWRDGWMDGWMTDWVGQHFWSFTVRASHIHTLWVTGSFKTGANVQKLLCLQACFCNGESSGWGKEAFQILRPEILPCLLASVNLFVCSVLTFQLLVICKAGEA